jgi:predicted hotdog family 3-hydroxylacyl-ACP dehydratase
MGRVERCAVREQEHRPVLDQLEPYSWSSEESVAYEAAIEAINAAVGAYSAVIAEQESKAAPDAAVIAAAEAAQATCALHREQLDPTDHDQISATRRQFAELAERIRAGQI